MYDIADPQLDQLIMDARSSADQAYRKAMYKACLDIIVDWAVEVPVYQRKNGIIFSTERVNMATVTPDITTFYGWMGDIQGTELNK
jgi:peptide/nickel transport system substrate-binding protein